MESRWGLRQAAIRGIPLDDGDFHAVNRRERVEQALPFLAAVAAEPELAGGGAEVERGRRKFVDVHRVAQHGEVGGFFGETLAELFPGVAAVFGAPDGGGAA